MTTPSPHRVCDRLRPPLWFPDSGHHSWCLRSCVLNKNVKWKIVKRVGQNMMMHNEHKTKIRIYSCMFQCYIFVINGKIRTQVLLTKKCIYVSKVLITKLSTYYKERRLIHEGYDTIGSTTILLQFLWVPLPLCLNIVMISSHSKEVVISVE